MSCRAAPQNTINIDKNKNTRPAIETNLWLGRWPCRNVYSLLPALYRGHPDESFH